MTAMQHKRGFMMVEIKQRGRDYNWSVFRDGVHVDALVTVVTDPLRTWRLWKDNIEYSDDERAVTDDKLAQLNGEGLDHVSETI